MSFDIIHISRSFLLLFFINTIQSPNFLDAVEECQSKIAFVACKIVSVNRPDCRPGFLKVIEVTKPAITLEYSTKIL